MISEIEMGTSIDERQRWKDARCACRAASRDSPIDREVQPVPVEEYGAVRDPERQLPRVRAVGIRIHRDAPEVLTLWIVSEPRDTIEDHRERRNLILAAEIGREVRGGSIEYYGCLVERARLRVDTGEKALQGRPNCS